MNTQIDPKDGLIVNLDKIIAQHPGLGRLERFRDLCSKNFMYQKLARKLTEAEFDDCVAFIEDNSDLDNNEFAHKLNRWKLDQLRSKHHTDMWALLTACNTGRTK